MNPSLYELPEDTRYKIESLMTREEYNVISSSSSPGKYASFLHFLDAGANRAVLNAVGLILSTEEDLHNADYLDEIHNFIRYSTFAENAKDFDLAYLDTIYYNLYELPFRQLAKA